MIKIFIDAGHGGDSIGAVYNDRKEQDDCLRLVKAVRDKLLTQTGVEVKLSREDDTNPSLASRCEMANTWGANYFLSIHRNAYIPNQAKGVEIWLYSNVAKGGDTYRIGEKLLMAVVDATGFVNRGVKLGAPSYSDFAVNKGTKMSSALLEVGFIDNVNDNVIFDTCFEAMVENIAKTLYTSLGGKWANPVADDSMYRVVTGSFRNRAYAENRVKVLKELGFESFIEKVKKG